MPDLSLFCTRSIARLGETCNSGPGHEHLPSCLDGLECIQDSDVSFPGICEPGAIPGEGPGCLLLGCNGALGCYEADDDQDGCGDRCECPTIAEIIPLAEPEEADEEQDED